MHPMDISVRARRRFPGVDGPLPRVPPSHGLLPGDATVLAEGDAARRSEAGQPDLRRGLAMTCRSPSHRKHMLDL